MKNDNYTAVIVDDEEDAREMIALLLNDMFPIINVVDKISTVTAATRAIPAHNPDIIFLDIKLTDGLGFDLLKRLPALNSLVIFITAYDDYAIRAIKASAFDYILKPVDEDEFADTVNKALAKLGARQNRSVITDSLAHVEVKKIGLPSLTGYNFVDAQNIVRCEADGHYTNIYFTNSPKAFISKSLSYFENELQRFGFFRIHHKHLINLNFITAYSKGKGGGYITMTDGAELEVATRKKTDLLRIISQAEV